MNINKLNLIILDMKNKYEKKIKNNNKKYVKLSKNYSVKNMVQCMVKQKQLIISIIKEVICFFPSLSKSDFIMLNGSFARKTNIWGSDLDLNIMYDSKYKEELFPIELAINYVLSRILNFRGCDRIHSIMVYTPLIGENNIKIDNGVIPYGKTPCVYYCRENYQKLLYETFNTSRDYLDLLSYFNSKIKINDICNEWMNNFSLLKDFGKYKYFMDGLRKNDKKIQENKNLNNILYNEIEQLLFNLSSDFNNNICDSNNNIIVSKLKLIYKTIPINNINKMMSILYHIHKKNMRKIFMNLEFYKKNNIINKKLYNSILKYLWCIMRVQIVVNEFDMDLSSHSSRKIKNLEFVRKYYDLYNDNYIKVLNKNKRALYKNIIEVLKKERKK